MAEISLAGLDDAATISLDPRIWEANRTAIEHVNAELAAMLAQTSMPTSMNPATTLDGFAAYREATNDGIRWMGGSSTPVKRAEPYVGEFKPGETNVALPVLSAGAELRLLLEKCPERIGVFVFVEDVKHAAGFLRLHDVAREVRALRCVLLTPGREEESLRGILDRHEGLLAPGSVLRVAQVSAERMQMVLDTCNRAAHETAARRAEAIRRLSASSIGAEGKAAGAVRCAVVSMKADARATTAAAMLASAARRERVEVAELTVTGPGDVHPLRFARATAEFAPNLTVCINHARAYLPVHSAGMNCEWWTSPVEDGAGRNHSEVTKLAASPVIAESLLNAGAKAERVIPFYWAAPNDVSATGGRVDEVWLIADLPDATDRACGIDLPTHVLLWSHARRSAEALLASGNWNPVAILTHAEQTSGVGMKDAATRSGFLNLIASVIVPTVVLEKLARELEREGSRIRAWGAGWARLNEPEIRVDSASWLSLSDEIRSGLPIAAVYYSPRDALHPTMPMAAVAGCPIVVVGEPSVLRKQLGGVLEPGRHVEAAGTAKEATAIVRELAAKADRRDRMVERARTHVSERHLTSHRWAELIGRWRGAAGASC